MPAFMKPTDLARSKHATSEIGSSGSVVPQTKEACTVVAGLIVDLFVVDLGTITMITAPALPSGLDSRHFQTLDRYPYQQYMLGCAGIFLCNSMHCESLLFFNVIFTGHRWLLKYVQHLSVKVAAPFSPPVNRLAFNPMPFSSLSLCCTKLH